MPRGKRSLTLPKRGRHRGQRWHPSKTEIARMGALKQIGHSAFKISQILGRSHNTIQRYLRSDLFRDPQFAKKVELIKEHELLDLYSLGAKARLHLNDLIEVGALSPIESVALMDRTFQQRRLLEGKSTENIASLTKIIQAVHAEVLPAANPKIEGEVKNEESPS